jgi:hypothetical protein
VNLRTEPEGRQARAFADRTRSSTVLTAAHTTAPGSLGYDSNSGTIIILVQKDRAHAKTSKQRSGKSRADRILCVYVCMCVCVRKRKIEREW